jgi:hypothetical protein
MTSLKAVKTETKKPSAVEIVLSDTQKLSIAPIVALCNEAFQLTEKRQELSLLSGKANQVFAHEFVNHVKNNELDYAGYMAFKKHIVLSVANARKNTTETVDKWLTPLIKAYVKDADLKGWMLPKAEGRSAKSMGALRTALASLTMQELERDIQASAKSGDFKKASQLAGEKKRRVKLAETEAKRNESKHVTTIKNDLRAFIGSLDSEGLAAMLYVKNHFATIKQMAIES